MKGLRGPRPIPTALKLLRGNPGRYPLNLREPQPLLFEDAPKAPDFLDGYALQEWRRIIGELHRMKLVTLVDINPLAAYCQCYKRWRTAEELLASEPLKGKAGNGADVANPLIGIAEKSAAAMVKYAAEFGFTPAARSRITAGIGEARKPTKFDGLLAS
jgi:P27 family predicted phage terminase small subunit